MAFWYTFIKFEISSSGVAVDYNSCLVRFKQIFLKYANRPLQSAAGCHARQDHSEEQFTEGRRALKAVKAL
jgi:hypothetical protein